MKKTRTPAAPEPVDPYETEPVQKILRAATRVRETEERIKQIEKDLGPEFAVDSDETAKGKMYAAADEVARNEKGLESARAMVKMREDMLAGARQALALTQGAVELLEEALSQARAELPAARAEFAALVAPPAAAPSTPST